MPFNAERFEAAKFEARKGRVAVPALAPFFDESEEPVWEVRGLNSHELHTCLEAGKRQNSVEAIVRAIASNQEQTKAIRAALGLTTETPAEMAKRLEMLVFGSVNPVVTLPQAVKLAEAFPIEFLMLTNEITELTGKGFDLVKPEATSQQTSPSEAQ